MTVESWKKEFYPIPAHEYARGRHSRLQTLDASLLKWSGLTKANLKKHRVYINSANTLADEHSPEWDQYSRFYFDAESCSLCAKYYNNDDDCSLHPCIACPIRKLTGNTCLNAFDELPDPKPMINLLTKVRKLILKDNAKRRGK